MPNITQDWIPATWSWAAFACAVESVILSYVYSLLSILILRTEKAVEDVV